MRIGIMLQSCDETMGGIGVYTREIVRALLRVDDANEYILIYPGFGHARAHRGQFRAHKNATEIETRSWLLPFFEPKEELHGAGTLRALRKIRALLPVETHWDQVVVPRVAEQYGLDVLFNPHLTVPIRGRFGKVTVVHNVEYHTVPKVYTPRIYSWWFLLEKCIMPAADRLISLSNIMTDDFRKHINYPIAQVRTIYHGVSENFRMEKDCEKLARARAAYKLPERFILFVGNLYPQKNFATLARAFAIIKDEIPHRLIVAGRPRYKFRGDVNLIKELGLCERVDLLNYVPNEDMPLLYNLADCFVYPSLYESFGLAQLEAMACGCPVIGAAAGAIPEVCGGAALLFDPHSPQELSEAILKVTCEPSVRSDLIERGLLRVRNFTWERAARETLDVFKELV
jgi:glycosyltransferase involved in cell wall biosynthesis